MTTIAKSAISLVAIGTIGGVGAYAGGLFESKKDEPIPTIKKATYKNKLEAEGFDLNIDSVEWGKILVEYNKNQDVSKTFKTRQEDVETNEGLKNKCEKFWKKDEINETDYKKLKQWCVKKEKMQDVLIRGKQKTLNFEEPAVPAEETHWKEKIAILRSNQNKFPSVQITNDDNSLSANIAAIKKGCKALEISTMETTNDKFEGNFKLAKDWCTIPTT